MSYPPVELRTPAWLAEEAPHPGIVIPRVEDRMRLVTRLAARNVREGTGGPFGAAVFEERSHRLVAPAVNIVISSKCSLAHAEMMALSLAQRLRQSYDLRAVAPRRFELVSSTEPCAMCLGALPWSGITRLVCGARDEDAREAGFDEGSKPLRWEEELNLRGIEVVRDVQREAAARVLLDYRDQGGAIYNPRPPAGP